ncbi:MAG: PIN domain-containing protein [Candidatus Hydrogenedentota bacterium]|nr:MAG: PIN domain-containing protein [Candidatus Hydrogenedentota bacterium]
MIDRILDASVAIAWYLPERFSMAAREWRKRFLDQRVRFIVPELHYWEIGNVLRTYVRRGELDRELALEIYDTHLAAPLEVIAPNRETVLSTAMEYGATVYDSVYISLALKLDVPLLTAERTTTPWVVKLGEKVDIVRE